MATDAVPGSSRIWCLRGRTGGSPTGVAKTPSKRCSRSSSTSMVIDSRGGALDIGSVACQQTRCPFRTKTMVRAAKSHSIGPSDSNHWTSSTILYEPSARPKQLRVKGSSPMVMGRSLEHPGLCTHSSFATVTRNPAWLPNLMPMRVVVLRSTKLWVDLKSRRVVIRASLMTMQSCMVRLVRGRIPVSAWMEITVVSVAFAGVVVVDHLDAEQLLAHLLVPVREEFITMKTLPILAALGHLSGSKPPDG
jgi:hypothetical protein